MSGLINLMQLWANGLATLVRGEIYKHEVTLDTPLTSTSWDGDSHSTTAATLIDLSAVFGVPPGVKAVKVRIEAKDSAAWGTNGNYISLGPSATAYYQLVCPTPGGDVNNYASGEVNCDENGDIYYRVVASGVNTLDVRIDIWGYYI